MVNTDICNVALSYIGRGRIIAINEPTEIARQCDLHYDNTRKLVLRQYEWGFARHHEKLEVVDTEINGYKYIYMYPEKCIRMLALLKDGKRFDAFRINDFEVFNLDNNIKVIACDHENAFIDYIYDVTDCDIFDSLFIEAFSRKLAANIETAVAGNTALTNMQYQMYQAAIQEAKSLSAKEKKATLEYPHSYADVRGGD